MHPLRQTLTNYRRAKLDWLHILTFATAGAGVIALAVLTIRGF